MYSHIVMFRLEDPEDAPHVKRMLMAMDGRIPQLRYIEVGIDDAPDPRSSHVVLITRFDSPEALRVYATHPHHLEVIAALKDAGVVESRKVDYAD
ncbi:MAG: Dabb family protein [Proteobacteria bacterium]|nr:Dabb family protein [Pseudomonadota bacterium]